MTTPDQTYIVKTQALLSYLGVSANYVGFFHTSFAVYLAAREPVKLSLITKLLYPEVARHYHTSWHAVERNIRATIAIIWAVHSERLSDIAGYPLTQKPRPAQFLFILASHIKESVENP